MKRKYYWWILGVIQVAGIMGTVEAMFLQFPTLLIVSEIGTGERAGGDASGTSYCVDLRR